MIKELISIFGVFLKLAKSRKFWVLLSTVLATEVELTLEDGTQAFVYLVAGVTFAVTTAWENSANGW